MALNEREPRSGSGRGVDEPVDGSTAVFACEDTLMRELDGEALLVNLASGNYYSLDSVGADIWSVLVEAPDIDSALVALSADYEVDADTLRRDVGQLIASLLAEGLIRLGPRRG